MATNIPKSLQIKNRKSGRFRLNFWQRKVLVFYGFVSPWIVGFILLSVLPMIFAILISFTNFNGFDLSGSTFIGLSNYAEAFQNPDAWKAFGLTFKYALFAIPLGLGVALSLAMILNIKLPGRGIFRTIFYLPTMVPGVATALVFQAILNTNSGFLNLFISFFRRGTVIDWLGDYGIACLVAMGLWGCGTTMVIFLAGLQGVPEELRESAMIDGANKWQIFRNITWPILSPITYFQLMMGIIGALQMYVPAGILGQSGVGTNFWNPMRSIFVYPMYALSQMMSYQRFGYGAALIWILFIIIMILALIIQKTSKYWVFYAVDQEGGKEE